MAYKSVSPEEVPVIDMRLPEPVAADAVRKACVETGFFYVAHHGVPEELVAAAFAANKALFALPREEKMKLLQDRNNRGYTPFAEETLDPGNQSVGDTKEGFYFGREVDVNDPEASKPLHGPNQWPDEALLPGYRATTEAYMAALRTLANRITRLLALALGLEADFFAPYFEAPMMFLRPLRYAAQVSDPGAGVYGCGAHSDYGMLTVLATDTVPGLQVRLHDEWCNVPPRAGSFIINLGQMLERWSNGRFRATLHRVVNTTGQERSSIAFFYEPAFDTPVEVLPQCCAPSEPPGYPATTAGRHLLDLYAATHAGYDRATKAGGSSSPHGVAPTTAGTVAA